MDPAFSSFQNSLQQRDAREAHTKRNEKVSITPSAQSAHFRCCRKFCNLNFLRINFFGLIAASPWFCRCRFQSESTTDLLRDTSGYTNQVDGFIYSSYNKVTEFRCSQYFEVTTVADKLCRQSTGRPSPTLLPVIKLANFKFCISIQNILE